MPTLIEPETIRRVAETHRNLDIDLSLLHEVSKTCKILDPNLLHRVDETVKILQGTGCHDLQIEVKESQCSAGMTGVFDESGVFFRIDLNEQTEINLFQADDSGNGKGETFEPTDVQPGDQHKMLVQALTKIRQATEDLLATLGMAK